MRDLTSSDYLILHQLQCEIGELIRCDNMTDVIIPIANNIKKFGEVFLGSKFHRLANDLISFSLKLRTLSKKDEELSVYIEGIYFIMRELANEKNFHLFQSYHSEYFCKEIEKANNYLNNN